MIRIDKESRKWWVLGAMGGVLGLVVLDETAIGVALPTIQRDLGLTQVGGHWVVNAYLLVFAGLVAAAGKLGDLIGLKVLLLIGIAIFGLASLASGFSLNGAWLVTARAVQGIGAAIIFPASMAVISAVFPEKQRGMALGIYGAIGAVGLSLGPLLGGILTHSVSWRWIFWINPPITILVAFVVLATWQNPPLSARQERFDLLGFFTLVAGLGMLVLGIMQGPEWGWSDPAVWILLLGGLASLGLFVWVELWVKLPLIEVGLFGDANFSACNLVIFLAQFTKLVAYVMIALYCQRVLGMTALEAGFAMLAAVIATPFACLPAGRLADRLGARRPALFAVAGAAASFLWIGLASGWDNFWLLVPGMLLYGTIQPVLFVPTLRAVMNTVPLEKQGQASGIVLTAQILGGSIGMATTGTLLALTGDFQLVFFVTAGMAFFVLAVSWPALGHEDPTASD